MTWDPVFRFVKQIPRGRVLTYGALAKALRLPGGARSAGRAMAATPSGKGIPWDRVIGECVKILILEPYASLQRKLLESEGVTILESRVDLKRHLWKPPAKSKLNQRTRKKRTQKGIRRLVRRSLRTGHLSAVCYTSCSCALRWLRATTMSDPILQVENLVKRYGDVEAVRGVSFSVEQGEVFGLLGPNGAGKTTTVEILEGLRDPDGGRVSVCGLDPQRESAALKHEIGAALQSTSLPDKLRVMEALRLFARFYKRGPGGGSPRGAEPLALTSPCQGGNRRAR